MVTTVDPVFEVKVGAAPGQIFSYSWNDNDNFLEVGEAFLY